MIKEDNRRSKRTRPPFHPAFGSRPEQVIGRDAEMASFLEGLDEPVGSQNRCTFFLGQRGMGKTALLLELADRAAEAGYVVARATAYEGMTDDVLESIQFAGAPFVDRDKRRIEGFEAGALGFSFGLTFTPDTDRQYGFRTKLALLCDELEKHGKGVLILVDEAHACEAMRELAITYQHLVGEDKDIAIAMAGLPHAVSSILNDRVLTFLNRARKVHLKTLPIAEIEEYYMRAFNKLGMPFKKETIARAAESTRGFPYLMQLVGYHLAREASANGRAEDDLLDIALRHALSDLQGNVFEPILAPLSDNDRAFLSAMAQDDGVSKVADIRKRLCTDNAHVQPYRARLIDAGVIETPRQGELVFAVPYLAEHLRET